MASPNLVVLLLHKRSASANASIGSVSSGFWLGSPVKQETYKF